jgi:hypothetical protein
MTEYVDFHLKACSSTLSFLKLPDTDKIHAIELGMKFLNMGNQQTQGWNNEQWNTKLITEKEKFETIIEAIKTDLKAEKIKLSTLEQQHKSEMQAITHQIKEQVKARYISDIEAFQTKLERYEKKLQDSNTENRNLFKQAYQEFEIKRTETDKKWEIKYETMRTEYENKLSVEKKEKEQLITTTQNSTIIGQVGEDFTLQELNKRFPRAEIEDTHKQKGRGDFIFKEDSFCMLIETKNYSKNVTKPEIDKFYRDIDINHDIHCGLFISIKSGICARDDFQLEVRAGKPIIFLHNISKNIHNLSLAVTLFKLILKTDSIDLTCKEIIDKIKISVPIIKRNWNKMRQKVRKFERELLECVADQETHIRNIFELMSLKY